MREAIERTLGMYGVPSQAYWRALELEALLSLRAEGCFEPPILEIGCGAGRFGAWVLGEIDDGIDANARAVERCRRQQRAYLRVHHMDARELDFPDGRYGTVFANSVLEHIGDIDSVLQHCARVLRTGGRLVATVPLAEMSRNLLLRGPGYARARQRRLAHLNLFSEAEWTYRLRRAGFRWVGFRPYLYGPQCRLWDVLDLPMCLGTGRYTVGGALQVLAGWSAGGGLPWRRLVAGALARLAGRADEAAARQAPEDVADGPPEGAAARSVPSRSGASRACATVLLTTR